MQREGTQHSLYFRVLSMRCLNHGSQASCGAIPLVGPWSWVQRPDEGRSVPCSRRRLATASGEGIVKKSLQIGPAVSVSFNSRIWSAPRLGEGGHFSWRGVTLPVAWSFSLSGSQEERSHRDCIIKIYGQIEVR